jgi:hypothetical protein
MAIRDDLIEALNTCIDRFNNGESLDAILQDYPQLAAQLRPMLESGFAVKRARFPSSDVQQVQQNTAPQVQQAISNTFTGGFFGFSRGLLLVVLIGSGLLLAALLSIMTQPDTPTVTASTPVVTMLATLVQATTPPVVTMEIIVDTVQLTTTATEAEVRVTVSVDSTSAAATSDMETSLPIESVSVIATAAAINDAVVPTNVAETAVSDSEVTETGVITIIEGPVDAIDGNQITIYNFDITLNAEDPRLGIIQLGDIMRVEGLASGAVVVVLAFDFTNVEVFVLDDIVWRDTGDCSNPPPSWAMAEGWRIRCEGTAPSTTNTGGGLPPGCKYTGFGNNNIRIKCS